MRSSCIRTGGTEMIVSPRPAARSCSSRLARASPGGSRQHFDSAAANSVWRLVVPTAAVPLLSAASAALVRAWPMSCSRPN